MKVEWATNALSHLADIYSYVSRDSPHYARRLIDRITTRSKQVGIFPESGQAVAEYASPEIREVIEGSYRLIYRVEKERVVVIAIIHGAQRLPTDL